MRITNSELLITNNAIVFPDESPRNTTYIILMLLLRENVSGCYNNKGRGSDPATRSKLYRLCKVPWHPRKTRICLQGETKDSMMN